MCHSRTCTVENKPSRLRWWPINVAAKPIHQAPSLYRSCPSGDEMDGQCTDGCACRGCTASCRNEQHYYNLSTTSSALNHQQRITGTPSNRPTCQVRQKLSLGTPKHSRAPRRHKCFRLSQVPRGHESRTVVKRPREDKTTDLAKVADTVIPRSLARFFAFGVRRCGAEAVRCVARRNGRQRTRNDKNKGWRGRLLRQCGLGGECICCGEKCRRSGKLD
ncbi:uncharacterized protein BKA78DRAFT_7521 [Phyllosticta capitalensis]|uniref:uncharacterized protein n=1 Tax=Phyllosticta capitalensis TaxID=121624 RepID=UPI003131F320